MRILHIIPSLAPETGGTADGVQKICQALTKERSEVVLFTSNWPNHSDLNSIGRSSIDGCLIETFLSKPSWVTANFPRSPYLVEAVKERSRDFDMVVIHSLWNPLVTFTMRELRRIGTRYCIMPHGMLDPVALKRNRWKKLPWAFLWEKKNIEGASLVIFNTEGEQIKARQGGWRFKRTYVFPHIVDLSEWNKLPSRSMFEAKFPVVKGREVILFVGRINWVKNLDKLLEALVIVRQQRPLAMLVCVGPDSDGYRSKLGRRARMLGVSDSLLFTGMMNRKDLTTAYARGGVFALVSQKENFGLAAAEALASGLPVVLSEGVDVGRSLPSGGPVRIVRPVPEEIAEALVSMLERSASLGLPDLEALSLAEKAWGDPRSSVEELINIFGEISEERKSLN
jgi:glycosyltransferase involved in cell wall biosynthesis